MNKRTFFTALVAFSLLVHSSCIFDPEKKGKDDGGGGGGTPYGDLTVRDNVLKNLVKSYNERNLDQYKRLLDKSDPGFLFHFSPADVRDGKVTVTQWDRAAEERATTNMFNPNFAPQNGDPISNITLNMTWPEGNENWTIVQDPDPTNYPGETWYEMTVDYVLTVVAGETTFTSGNTIQASFVVRGDENGEYHIIAWRDDIGS